MLAKRIIPTMLVRGRALVKGQGFNAWRPVGHALQAAKIYNARGVDELCLLDIAATAEHRGPDLALIEALADGCFMPLAVGGGIRTMEHVRDLLLAGADKVVIGTGALEVPGLVRAIADRYGSQAVVVCVDYRESDWRSYTRCGTAAHPLGPLPVAIAAELMGAGEILLQAVERDGMMAGYDLMTINRVSHALNIPVIASGGAGTYHHMVEAIRAGADATAVGAMLQFCDATPRGAAEYMASCGIETRV